jgi:transposase
VNRARVVNEQGYRIGESHPRCRYPDAIVKRALDLHELDGLSYPEIGRTLGVPVATVEKWCQYRVRQQHPNGDREKRATSPGQLAALAAGRLARWPARSKEQQQQRMR